MPRHRPVGRLRRALAGHDLGGNERLAPSAAARPRHAQRPPSAQASRKLAPQCAPALHVKRLVDGLVADPHGRDLGKVEPQAPGDLLRAPRLAPAPRLPRPMPATLPGHNRPRHRGPAWSSNHAGQPVLHVNPQRRAGCKPRPLRTTRRPLRMPLRRGGPILQAAAARGRVAPQLARDGRSPANPLVRRRPPQPAGNLPNAEALHT